MKKVNQKYPIGSAHLKACANRHKKHGGLPQIEAHAVIREIGDISQLDNKTYYRFLACRTLSLRRRERGIRLENLL